MGGGNKIDTAPIASGEAKEKARHRTRSASRLSLVERERGRRLRRSARTPHGVGPAARLFAKNVPPVRFLDAQTLSGFDSPSF